MERCDRRELFKLAGVGAAAVAVGALPAPEEDDSPTLDGAPIELPVYLYIFKGESGEILGHEWSQDYWPEIHINEDPVPSRDVPLAIPAGTHDIGCVRISDC